MPTFVNRPNFSGNDNNQIKRYTHQELTIEHYGIHAAIKKNGRVIISAVAKADTTKDEVVYDEVDIPASLVFKLASLLKATRKIEFVGVAFGENSQPEKED